MHPVGARWRGRPTPARVVLRTTTTEAVGFSVVIDLVRTDAEDEVVGHLGPDLLGPDWDADVALHRPAPTPTPHRRRVARPAQPRRRRQRVQVRALLPQRGHPWTPVGPCPTCRSSSTRPSGCSRPTRTASAASTTGDLRPGNQLLGLRARAALVPLRYAIAKRRPGPARPGAVDVLVPALPAAPGPPTVCPWRCRSGFPRRRRDARRCSRSSCSASGWRASARRSPRPACWRRGSAPRTIIWANTIATVLVALSVGYWLGGRLADRGADAARALALRGRRRPRCWPWCRSSSGPFLRQSVDAFDSSVGRPFAGSLLGVCVLIAVPVLLLGTISPYAVRLSVDQVEEAGRVSGRLYAISHDRLAWPASSSPRCC